MRARFADPAVVVGGVDALDHLVQLRQGGDLRDRDQVVAAEPADLALHAALLMSAVDAGHAVERVETQVRAEQRPTGRDSTRARPNSTRDTAERRLS